MNSEYEFHGSLGYQDKKHCKSCGSMLLHWDDIAEAMEQMIDVASNGAKPMMRQAIDEIRALRQVVLAADRLHSDTMYRDAAQAKDFYMRERAKVKLP